LKAIISGMLSVGVSLRRPQHEFFTAYGTLPMPKQEVQERQERTAVLCWISGPHCRSMEWGKTLRPSERDPNAPCCLISWR